MSWAVKKLLQKMPFLGQVARDAVGQNGRKLRNNFGHLPAAQPNIQKPGYRGLQLRREVVAQDFRLNSQDFGHLGSAQPHIF